MIKDFKLCWISHDKVYLTDSDNNTYTLTTIDLRAILSNTDLKAIKQLKNYKLEVLKNEHY